MRERARTNTSCVARATDPSRSRTDDEDAHQSSTGRTIYYRAILVDQSSGAFAAQSNYAAYYLGSGASVTFGNMQLNVPWQADIHNHVVGLEVWACQGNTAVTHDLLRIDTYRIYGLSSLGMVAEGAYSSYC